ncbi:MAG: rod shape-determining protein MreD [Alphaproteobacteria bacterium]|nr:rod shape-determining protein MreD [Alphaproteobacteria bacterium]
MLDYAQVALLWLLRRVWLSLPLILTIAFMLAMTAPMDLLPVPAPDIALIAVFFWALSGPNFLPPVAVLVLGLAQDFVTGTPIGFWALIYLLAYGFTLSQRVFFKGRTGFGAWVGFAIVAALTAIASWLLGSIVYTRWLPPAQIYLQAAVSILAYWPVSKVFSLMRRSLTTARDGL